MCRRQFAHIEQIGDRALQLWMVKPGQFGYFSDAHDHHPHHLRFRVIHFLHDKIEQRFLELLFGLEVDLLPIVDEDLLDAICGQILRIHYP